MQRKVNAKNEQIKRSYFDFLRHADGKSEKTIRIVERAILQFESFTSFADFKRFDQKQAIAYKTYLGGQGPWRISILRRA